MKIVFTLSALLLHLFINAQNDPELFPINDRKVGYMGYYLQDGTNIVKPQFCSATYIIEGYYRVSKADHEMDSNGKRKENHIPNTEKFALLNSKGHFVIDFNNSYDFIDLDKGIIIVLQNKFYGTVNSTGKIIIPIKYTEIIIADKNRVIAVENEKYGILNYLNEIIIPFNYDSILGTVLNENNNGFYALVKEKETYGVINQSNKYVTPKTNIVFTELTNKSILAKKNNKFGLLNYNLKPLLPFEFESLDIEDNKLNATKKGRNYHYDFSGKLIN